MEFLLMMLIYYQTSARLILSQYPVEHLDSERGTLRLYYLGFATRR
jgi:hypothetical protein